MRKDKQIGVKLMGLSLGALIVLSGCSSSVKLEDVNKYNNDVQKEVIASEKFKSDEKTSINHDLMDLEKQATSRDIEGFIKTKENLKNTLINVGEDSEDDTQTTNLNENNSEV